MRKKIIPLAVLLIASTSCQQQKDTSSLDSPMISLEEGFKDPPLSVRPKGYWDWMNGNFDLSRLTYELEEAKAQGMAGFDIFDIGAVSNPEGMVPAGPAFMGEECLEAISHAVKEATRLDMELGLILSSSWDAGGSWIRPEHGSMALYETSKVVSGPGEIELDLPFPELPTKNRAGKNVFIEKNADGMPVYYKDVAVLAIPFSEDEIIVDPSQVIDLSAHVDEDGRLTWSAGEGTWEISRFVCANTGEMLKCPSPNSAGLSMDHFSPEATEFHFNYFIERLQEKLGDIGNTPIKYFYLCSYEVVGFVWTPRMLEEFEKRRGYDMTPYLPVLQGKIIQNKDVTERFLYDYRQTLSDLLIENLYLKGREMVNPHGIKLCSESGGPGAPVHNVPVDALRALGVLDIPRGEFWNKHQRYDEQGLDVMQLVKEISCAAHIYGKKEVQGEAFTSFLHWQEGPAELKPLADKAMCEGLNRFVYHTSPHTTPDAGIPGYVYHAGTHFNATRVWWPKSRPFSDYLARSCFLLQQGNFVGDVLFYYGDQAPNFVKPKHVDPSLGFGYDYDVTNSEVILTRLDVKDGQLVLPGGQSYEILVLPDQDHANPEVLMKIENLVKKGATIVGRKPTRSHGLKDYAEKDELIKKIAKRLWGACDGRTITENQYGKGKVIWGKTLKQVMLERGLGPDFSFTGNNDSANLDFIHRKTSSEEIYFVSNTRNESETINGIFRVNGKIPEIWDPETGTMQTAGLYDLNGETTRIPLKLQPHGSVFIVFRANDQSQHITTAEYEGKQIFPGTDKGQGNGMFADVQRDGNEISLIAWEKGQYALTDNTGNKNVVEVSDIPSPVNITGDWKIDFPPGWGAPDQIVIPELMSWTDSDHEGLKYFSGIATYNKKFDIPREYISDELIIFLNLGKVREVVEIYLNGEKMGILWKPPYQKDITWAAKAGENTLTLEVANTWSNRLTGDGLLPESERYTKTNITGPNFQNNILWKDAPLLESGLIGPVSIQFARKIALKQ
ncbi:MAG: hypothetical protein AMS26_11000 [Bacteroides sp. SM23_62]|nr:MAG: hypothetical protein AMS26_11000 [Bacteroides sp. SM23_62]